MSPMVSPAHWDTFTRPSPPEQHNGKGATLFGSPFQKGLTEARLPGGLYDEPIAEAEPAAC